MSKLEKAPTAFTFDDFNLAPVHSSVRSRKDPDVSVGIKNFNFSIPIISAPMNTITEADMVRAMHDLGGSSVLHRYMSIEDQVKVSKELVISGTLQSSSVNNFFAAVGANGDAIERTSALNSIGVKRYCIDVANGHSDHCIEAVRTIRRNIPDAVIMAGNVCTYNGAIRLVEVGADAIRVGIGPGALCTTRLVTGHGVPQLTAIEDCARIKQKYPNVCIIADGGIRNSGDIVKALAIGADMVMVGSLLSGTSETPGPCIEDPQTGLLYKNYFGMASEEGRSQWFGREQTAFVPEGAATKVAFKGDTDKVVERLIGGLKVGMSYAGAFNLQELRQNVQWYRITGAGQIEGTPHGKI